MIEDTDTRDGSQIWLVKFTEKMEREQYKKVASILNTLNGYYSRFKHGFIFRYDPTEVLTISATSQEDASKQEQPFCKDREAKEKAGREKQAAKINKAIESISKKIEGLSGNYKTNTAKRMRETASRSNKILDYKQDILILKYLLKILETRPLSEFETALITTSFRNSMNSFVWCLDQSRPVEFPCVPDGMPQWYIDKVPKEQSILKRAGINNTESLIQATMQYKTILKYTNEVTGADQEKKKIQDLENKYKLWQNGDIQFTPPEVVKKLIDLSGIDQHSKVLEPSAGIGSIADAIKGVTSNLDVCEVGYSFRELLDMKGHNVVAGDFLEYEPDQKYDAIIMNPPFSNNQDIKHLTHAYELLKPGGRLVCLTSLHWRFAKEKKCPEFRVWIEEQDYFQEEVACGTFDMTGVSSLIVVINKPDEAVGKTV